MTVVNPLSRVDAFWPSPDLQKPVQTAEPSDKTFGEILKTSINEVNRLQLETDGAIQDLVSGKEKNVHEVMVAMEKASLSLELLVQVRNKVLAAYDEIKRMQI
jgi:flagellar hook-basal body complex protein FliE